MKKILFLVMGILMLEGTYASAAQLHISLDVTQSKYDTITITPEFEKNNVKWVSMTVTDENSNPVYYGQKRPNEEDMSFIVNLDEDTLRTRSYKAVMQTSDINGGVETVEQNITYYSFDEIDAAIKKVLSGELSIKDAEDILSVDLTGLYSNINNDSLIVSQIKEILSGDSDVTMEDFKTAYDKALVKTAIKSKNAEIIKVVIENYAGLVGIDSSLKEYSWYNEGSKSAIISDVSLSEYDSESSFLQSFRAAVFLDRLSGMHSSKIIDFLRTNNNSYYQGNKIFTLDFENFDRSLGTIAKKDYASVLISKADTSTLEKLKDAFNSAITIAKNYSPYDSGNGSGGSGGSGGGGGGGDGYVFKTSQQDKSEVQTQNKTFGDIDTVPWAKTEIEYLAQKGIINGKSEGNFNPDDNITREEFVAIIVRAFKMQATQKVEYSDVARDAWYYESVNAAYENGIATGFEDKFGVGENITRQDMAVMLYRIVQRFNIKLEAKSDIELTDKNDISEYAYEAVNTMYTAQFINGMGDGSFKPLENATRAQAAKLIYNLLK